MKLLVAAATQAEIQPFISHLAGSSAQVDLLITGVGMMGATYALTHRLAHYKYDLVLQAGVGGSFDRNIALGEVVFVATEQYGDLGAEDHDNYLDIFGMGLIDANSVPHSSGKLVNPLSDIHRRIALPHVSGLTVNTVSGSERTITRRTQQYHCQVESMEGAALHYVCLQLQQPFAQVRSISNYVTPRDKSQWRMKDAIINLNDWLIGFVKSL